MNRSSVAKSCRFHAVQLSTTSPRLVVPPPELPTDARLQQASLALGTMHARMGHIEEALQALNETVRTMLKQQSLLQRCFMMHFNFLT